MKAVYKTPLLLHHFSPVVALLLSYCPDLVFLYRIFLWSLFSFSPVITTLLGWIPTDSCVISLFFPLHSFNVYAVFLPVHLDHFANLLAFVVSLDNLNIITLSNGHRWNTVLLFQLSGKRGRYDLFLNVRQFTEMLFVVLASVGSHKRDWISFWPLWSGNDHQV